MLLKSKGEEENGVDFLKSNGVDFLKSNGVDFLKTQVAAVGLWFPTWLPGLAPASDLPTQGQNNSSGTEEHDSKNLIQVFFPRTVFYKIGYVLLSFFFFKTSFYQVISDSLFSVLFCLLWKQWHNNDFKHCKTNHR